MFEEFKGKVIFITGAGSGMGRATAIRFAEMGAKVAVTARRQAPGQETVKLIQDKGGEAIFIQCDVSDDASVKAAVEKTIETYGSLDYAFNNAGCGADGKNIPFGPLTEVTEEDWDKVMNTNLKGVFHCMKYQLIQMQKQGSGAIVNTSSIGGLHMVPGFGAYGPSKAGIQALSQVAAVENAKAGIRVNVICPGPTLGTNLMDASIASGDQDPEFMAQNVIPLGKMGQTSEIVDSVVFLCSNMSSHITGSIVPVCGGMQM